MIRLTRSFWKCEDGAITVDWVVLAAGAISLAFGATSMVAGGVETQSDFLAASVAERPVGN